MAVSSGNSGVVSLLVERRAELESRQKPGITPMLVAAQNGNTPTVLRPLHAGADTTLCRSDGETPLDAAHRNGHSECVELLTSRRRLS